MFALTVDPLGYSVLRAFSAGPEDNKCLFRIFACLTHYILFANQYLAAQPSSTFDMSQSLCFIILFGLFGQIIASQGKSS